jgi:ABC-2 type transport system ATP-binding protein
MPTAGTVRVDGHDLHDAPLPLRQEIGFLPESPPLHADMRVRDFLRFVGELRGMEGKALQARIDEVAGQTSIVDELDRIIGTLSHGFRKRVGIAQAILHQPKLVILDEPISGLDPAQIVEMRQIIAGLAKTCTVLLSSHILAEVSQTCDRILVLSKGKIVADGTEAELAKSAQGGTSVRMTLRGTREAIVSILDASEQVASWSILSESADLLTIAAELTGDHREAIVKTLIQSDIGVRSLTGADTDLESTFLNLTRGEVA